MWICQIFLSFISFRHFNENEISHTKNPLIGKIVRSFAVQAMNEFAMDELCNACKGILMAHYMKALFPIRYKQNHDNKISFSQNDLNLIYLACSFKCVCVLVLFLSYLDVWAFADLWLWLTQMTNACLHFTFWWWCCNEMQGISIARV